MAIGSILTMNIILTIMGFPYSLDAVTGTCIPQNYNIDIVLPCENLESEIRSKLKLCTHIIYIAH